MKKRIPDKLRSRAGASITFALLLFLVCAVLCSVIITAATASAGRMSELAEADQRYYSVLSASELMKEMIGGKTVSVVKVTTSWSTTTYTDDTAASVAEDTDGTAARLPVEKKYIVVGQNAMQILAAVGTAADCLTADNQVTGEGAWGTALPTASILNDAAFRHSGGTTIPETPDGSPRTLTLESSADLRTALGVAPDKDPLAVTMEETLDSTGTITLTVCNANGDPFKQELVFRANVFPGKDTKSADGSPENYTSWETTTGEGASAVTTVHSSYTITTTTNVIEIMTLTWDLDSIKTLSGTVTGD